MLVDMLLFWFEGKEHLFCISEEVWRFMGFISQIERFSILAGIAADQTSFFKVLNTFERIWSHLTPFRANKPWSNGFLVGLPDTKMDKMRFNGFITILNISMAVKSDGWSIRATKSCVSPARCAACREIYEYAWALAMRYFLARFQFDGVHFLFLFVLAAGCGQREMVLCCTVFFVVLRESVYPYGSATLLLGLNYNFLTFTHLQLLVGRGI